MPVLFLGHGNPMNAIEKNTFTEGFRKAAEGIPRPKSILCISAHWETSGTYLTAMQKPRTIHDFGGFPEELYKVQYPAPGNPELAAEAKGLVTRTRAELDTDWGLDHGCWSVIKHMYPDADVPVIQMSLDYGKKPDFHYELGGELASLRKKGVLIIGSGNLVHNLRMVNWRRLGENFGYDWALEASEKMKKYILEGNHKELINFRSQGEAFDLAIPTAEHFLPLLYVLALKEKNESIEIFNDEPVGGSLTMTSVLVS